MRKWEFAGHALPLGAKTYLMGILNLTPDSFSDGGQWDTTEKAVAHALQMEADGADIIDIGAQSTRPGHAQISAEEEWLRLKPVLCALQTRIQTPVSVDTYYPAVAQRALAEGAVIINDVSGWFNPEMAKLIAAADAGWVVMHTGGGTADVIASPHMDIVAGVNAFFADCLSKCEAYGIRQSQLCLDMGIGFGKTYEQNLALLRQHALLCHPHNALLTGLSRKRVVGQATGIKLPAERLPGNLAAHTCAIAGGTDILRVHDVKEERAAAKMADVLFRTTDKQ